MSVSMWFKFDVDSWNASHGISGGLLAEFATSEWGGNDQNYKDHGIGLQVYLWNGRVYFRTVKPSGGLRHSSAPLGDGGGGVWHHVTGTLSSGPLADVEQKIYLNGIAGEAQKNDPEILGREFLYDLSTIGGDGRGALGDGNPLGTGEFRARMRPFKGYIDNFGLWTTVGLTADQARVLYTVDSGGSAAPSPFSLVVNQPEYFHLEGDSGDSQAAVYNGTYKLDPDQGLVNNRGVYVESGISPSKFIAWSASAWEIASLATLDSVRGTRGNFTSLLASPDGYVAEFPQYSTRQCSHMVTSCDGKPKTFYGECSTNGAADYRMCNEVPAPKAVLVFLG
jgi:hypothetical protein